MWLALVQRVLAQLDFVVLLALAQQMPAQQVLAVAQEWQQLVAQEWQQLVAQEWQ